MPPADAPPPASDEHKLWRSDEVRDAREVWVAARKGSRAEYDALMKVALVKDDEHAMLLSAYAALQADLRDARNEIESHTLARAGEKEVTLGLLRDLAAARGEVERLRGWLEAIDGGDCPVRDESKLRRMAYEAHTLGHPAPGGR